MPGAALIVNPQASRVTPELALAVERELAAAGPIETFLTERPMQAAEFAEELCGRCRRIYVFAGDGGYNEVVNGVHGDVALGFIPAGAPASSRGPSGCRVTPSSARACSRERGSRGGSRSAG